MRSKISVKTRDCEHKMIGGFFERKCFCRKMLCNLGYDDRYLWFCKFNIHCLLWTRDILFNRQDIMRGEVRGQVLPNSSRMTMSYVPAIFIVILATNLSNDYWDNPIHKKSYDFLFCDIEKVIWEKSTNKSIFFTMILCYVYELYVYTLYMFLLTSTCSLPCVHCSKCLIK